MLAKTKLLFLTTLEHSSGGVIMWDCNLEVTEQ